MASKTVQMVFVVLGAIGVIGVIICCALPEWMVGHHGDTEGRFGLWTLCVKQRTEPEKCETHDASRMASEYLAFRALTIISCILGILSFLFLFSGVDFTPCVQNQDTKTKMILAAGVGLMLTGLLVIIPVSWMSYDFRNGVKEAMLGASIYIGFLSGLMLMLIGGLLCCLIRSGSSSSGGTISFFRNRA